VKTSGREGFSVWIWLLLAALSVAVGLLCVCVGSVNLPLRDTLDVFRYAILGRDPPSQTLAASIVLPVRLPRVLCAALEGSALSLCGCAMQGLLKNPLADGSTLGVASGASLGAVAMIAFGSALPLAPAAGTVCAAIVGAFVSIVLILSLSCRLDPTLSTHTIILTGVIFSMFASSISSLIITFAGDKLQTILFWTMGSLQGAGYPDAGLLTGALLAAGIPLLLCGRELNAFAIGEENARSIGVEVRRVKLTVFVCVSVLTGVCVSVGGTISFVGLVTPHMLHFLTGPNHRKLLPASLFGGAIFLMFADLIARVIVRPRELLIGVVTSFAGSIVFLCLFYTAGRRT